MTDQTLNVAPAETDVATIIRGRRTVNNFRPECPPRDLILQAIELARWAPNHKHTEPWRFHLLGPHASSRIVELNTRLVADEKGAEAAEAKQKRWSAVPGWLAVTCAVGGDPVRDEEDYAATCCAIQNLALYLWSAGVGTKWSTGAVTRHPEYPQLVGFDPETQRNVGLIWYGYPQSVPEQRRKGLAEIVNEQP